MKGRLHESDLLVEVRGGLLEEELIEARNPLSKAMFCLQEFCDKAALL